MNLSKLTNKYKSLSVVTKATLWFLVCSIIQKGLSLFTTPIFTRLLTLEQYGLYTLYNSWLQLAVILTTLRLDTGVFNKGMSKFKDDKDGYALSMQTTSTILTTIVLIAYLIFSKPINAFTELSTFVSLLIIFELYFTPAISFWTIRQRYDFKYVPVVIVTVLMSLSNAGLGVVAVLLSENKGVARIISCVIVQVIFGTCIYIINMRKGKKLLNKEYVKYALSFCIPLLPHYFSSYLLGQSDRIMIQKFYGEAQAAIYGVANNAANMLKIITDSLANALIPWQYRKLESKEFRAIEQKMLPIFIVVIGVVIVFSALAPEIIYVLASEEYHEAIYIIPPVATSVFFIFLNSLFANIEFFYDKNKMTMYLSCLAALINIILNFIFIPRVGYIAAGYTTLVSYMISSLSHLRYMNYLSMKNDNAIIFRSKYIYLMTVVLVISNVVLSFLYDKLLLRYGMLLVLFVVIVFNYKKILYIMKNLKKEG